MSKVTRNNLGLEFILLRNFNRRFTIRRLEQFGSPIAAPLSELELPINSILHYTSDESTVWGPSQYDELLTRSAPRGARVMDITEYSGQDIIGRPRHIANNINKELTAYHRLNMRMRKWHGKTDILTIQKDSRILMINNYAPLLPAYTYQSKIFSWYERWHNTFSTIVDSIKENVVLYDRQNYLFLDIPDVIPSINELRRAEARRDKNSLKDMRIDSVLGFLELWTWLGANREHSLLSKFKTGELRRINILIRSNGFFVCLNLGELDFWRIDENGVGRITTQQMQKRLFKTYVDFAKNVESLDASSVEETLVPFNDEQMQIINDEFVDYDNKLDLVLGVGDITQGVDNEDQESADAEVKNFDDTFNIDDDEVVVIRETVAESDDTVANYLIPATLEDGVISACDEYIDAGMMSAKRYHYIRENADAYSLIPNPFGKGTVGEAMVVTDEDLAIEDEPLIPNSSVMKHLDGANNSSIVGYDKKYITEVLHKDILNSVMSVQKAGFLVTDYSVEKSVDAAGGMLYHTLKVQPVNGEPSTLRFETPAIDSHGYWKSNNNRFTMRKQCRDLPIRKTGPGTVALTSGYGKNFIHRSKLATADYFRWLSGKITLIGADTKNFNITNVINSDTFNPDETLPRDYTGMSQHISTFTAGDVVYTFDYAEGKKRFKDFDEYRKDDLIPIGKSSTTVYLMGMDNLVYRKTKTGMESLGRLAEIININEDKAPRDYSVLSMMGKRVPLGVILCYYYGMENLFKQLGINYQRVERSDRIVKNDYDLIIQTTDNKFLLNFEDDKQRLIGYGLRPYLKIISEFTTKDMNNKDVYLNLIQKDGLSVRYLKELTNMALMFVDNIAKRKLIQMGEPTTFIGLVFRANELLTTDQHLEESDFTQMQVFTFQRVAMAIQTELTRSVRDYNARPGQKKKLELAPRAVWKAIEGDSSVILAADVSPMQSTREKYVVTKSGTGGRSGQSMVKHTRKFTDADIGVVSNDTVDSGEVGITYFLSDNPQFADLDGSKKKDIKVEDLKINSYLSAIEMCAPFVLEDDDKRRNFIGIQYHSSTFAVGYETSSVLTGSEVTIAHKCGPTQAMVAEGNGIVKKVSKYGIKVEYDGEPVIKKGYILGRTYGQYEGTTYPHDIVTNLKVGDRFNRRDVLTYNSHFFELDPVTPGQVNWKCNKEVNIIFIEGTDTWEDSCAIDEDASGYFGTSVTKVRDLTFNFNQAVHGLVSIGTHTEPDTILCTIEDELTAATQLFNEESLAILANNSAQTPRAKNVGTVDKIEVFYNGDIDDMSPTIKAIALAGDADRKAHKDNADEDVAETGEVTSALRIAGNPVELDSMVVRVYITHDMGTVGGDKLVFFNQLKATIRIVMSGENYSADGNKINVKFGRVSVDNRIVVSVYDMATATKVVHIYTDILTKELES